MNIHARRFDRCRNVCAQHLTLCPVKERLPLFARHKALASIRSRVGPMRFQLSISLAWAPPHMAGLQSPTRFDSLTLSRPTHHSQCDVPCSRAEIEDTRLRRDLGRGRVTGRMDHLRTVTAASGRERRGNLSKDARPIIEGAPNLLGCIGMFGPETKHTNT